MKTSPFLLALSGLALAVPPAPAVEKKPAAVAEPVTPPTTAEWLEQQVRDKRLDYRCAALLHRKFLKESFEDLHSHVGFWFAKWGATGHCDSYLAKGRPPTVSTLLRWLQNKWAHVQYRLAKDALSRNQGRRTQSEIRHRRRLKADDYILSVMHDPDAPKRVFMANRVTGELDHVEFVDPLSLRDASPLISDEEMSLVHDIIRLQRRVTSDLHIRMLTSYLSGTTRAEVALEEGVNLTRAKRIFRRVREDLRKSPVMISVALKVLDLVAEEPWSTRTEIEETLTSEGWETQALYLDSSQVGPKALKKTVGKALSLLSKRGLLSEGTGQAFAPTRQGRIASDIQSLV